MENKRYIVEANENWKKEKKQSILLIASFLCYNNIRKGIQNEYKKN